MPLVNQNAEANQAFSSFHVSDSALDLPADVYLLIRNTTILNEDSKHVKH